MGNKAGVRHYFVEAFTPYGYMSLLPKILEEIKYTYLLTGGPGTGKSTMIKLIGIQLIDRGYDVDYLRSVREPDSVAGLYLPKQKVCLIDQREFITEYVNLAQSYLQVIDFSCFCKESRLEKYKERITLLEEELEILEKEIIERMGADYEINPEIGDTLPYHAVDTYLSQFMEKKEELLPANDEINNILKKIKKNSVSFFFMQGLQPDGWLNLAPKYLKDFDRICLEMDDSSEVLRELLQEVKCLGQVIEIVIHPLKPYTMMGIIFPEKSLTVWKGNPCRLEEQGMSVKHSKELTGKLEVYKSKRIELKSLINDSVNFTGLDHMRNELLSSILSDIQQ